MEGYLVLENGTVYAGEVFGKFRERYGELIFNTSMTGYQEIIYDPSYKGQIVVMTYPLIGNYGMNAEDVESYGPHLEGLVVKEKSRLHSNWRADESIDDFFEEHGIGGIEGIDTRRITLTLREEGALKGGIFRGKQNFKEMVEKVRLSPGLEGRDLVREVARKEPFWWFKEGGKTVVAVDCGVKYNMLRIAAAMGLRVRVVPPSMPWQEVLKEHPDGLLLSNGPGDPAALPYVVDMVRNLLGRVPIFGICLGHQILGQALGGRTFKLKFGHHGANHPVKDLRRDTIAITVQNHGFCVDIDSLKGTDAAITHVNLNDGTLEGIESARLKAFSVQFHPEDSPGPRDARYLFDRFRNMIDGQTN